jgi:hypothetical protein
MADTHVAAQSQHMPLVKNVADKTITLAQKQMAILRRHDPGGILTSMLQVSQCVIQRLIHCTLTNDPDDSTHNVSL